MPTLKRFSKASRLPGIIAKPERPGRAAAIRLISPAKPRSGTVARAEVSGLRSGATRKEQETQQDKAAAAAKERRIAFKTPLG